MPSSRQHGIIMALKIILGIISIALCVNASKLLDMGPYSIDTNIERTGKYFSLDEYDFKATRAVDNFLKIVVKNDSLNPFFIKWLPHLDLPEMETDFAKLSNFKMVGFKSFKFDDIEMRMNLGATRKTNPFRIDMKLTAPLIELEVDVDAGSAKGHTKIILRDVKITIAAKTTFAHKTQIPDGFVFQLFYMGVKGSAENLKVQLDFGLPANVENDAVFVKKYVDMTKEFIAQYALMNVGKWANKRLCKQSAVEIMDYLVPDLPTYRKIWDI